MRYDKQELKKSKQAYESAEDLSYKNERLYSAEKFLWKFLGFFAFLAFFLLTKPGGEATFQEVLFSLVASGIILSPVSIFTIARIIMNRIISNKYKKGRYYVKYTNEIYTTKKRYSKAIDKIIAMVKSNDKNVEKEVALWAKDAEKESAKLSPEQEDEVVRSLYSHLEYQIKDFSTDERKRIAQLFRESDKER